MKRKRFPLVVALCLAASAGAAQQKRPMTIEDVLAVKSVSDAQISPDGRWVAYVVTSADMKENANDADVWRVATSGGEAMRMTTHKKSDTQPRWSPDGSRLAFLSAREEKSQIFLISPFGGEADKLTDSKSGVQAFAWSPDGAQIAYVAPLEPTPAEEKKQKDKDDAQVVDHDFKHTRIWLIDVRTKKARELVKGDFSAGGPQWSPDGRSIAYSTTPSPKPDDGNLTDIWIVDVESGKTRKLVENEGPDNAPRWSPDGHSIAFLTREAAAGQLGQTRIAVVPAAGGAVRFVSPTFVYQPGPVSWSPDGRTLFFSAAVRTTSQLFSVPAAGGEPKQLTKDAGVVGPVTFSKDGSRIAFTFADTQHAANIHTATLSPSIEPAKLTDHNPQIAELALGRSEVVRWKSKGGMEIEGLLIYPVDYQAGRRYPLVAQIHGGPSGVWQESFPSSWGNFAHVWAGKGWLVFSPNVRGSSAYGEKFLLANVNDWGGGDFQDIQTGLDFLVQKGLADPERMAQTGWSYGGYMTAWTITQTSRFKAAMVGAGLTNMFSMYSTNDLQRVLEGYFGGQPWNNLESYRRASAMTFIKQAKTPTLIQHGSADQRVPIGQAQELYMGLRKNGVPVELVFFPREPHGLGEPRHQLDKMRREYAWFSKHVLGVEVPEPKPEKFDTKEKKVEEQQRDP